MALFLGIDVGTRSTKAVVWNGRKFVARGQQGHQMLSTTTPGRAEQSPDTWKKVSMRSSHEHPVTLTACAVRETWQTRVQAVQVAVSTALNKVDATQVVAVGVSGQQHGLVPLNDRLEVIRPAKLWCDVEATSQAAHFSQLVGVDTPPGAFYTRQSVNVKNVLLVNTMLRAAAGPVDSDPGVSDCRRFYRAKNHVAERQRARKLFAAATCPTTTRLHQFMADR
jgi:sugar (pentulose or hexulose) kinase